jgi:hypothetical protein
MLIQGRVMRAHADVPIPDIRGGCNVIIIMNGSDVLLKEKLIHI